MSEENTQLPEETPQPVPAEEQNDYNEQGPLPRTADEADDTAQLDDGDDDPTEDSEDDG